ncbi:MAG TPA: barstar family protein [Holophagaceae bacterium]|nr:barstar family protein [Holophagaceae bacterium]
MKLDALKKAEAPFIHPVAEDVDTLWDALRANPCARLLRGARMGAKAGLMAEFAAALQFPPSFGANWDALDEALADLSWMGGAGAWLLITESDQVLAKATDEDRAIFQSMLEDLAEAWAKIEPPAPFHVVMNR